MLLRIVAMALLPAAVTLLPYAFAAGSSGCVLPLQFEEDLDASTDDNYPPVVIGASPPLTLKGIVQIGDDAPMFTIEVEDKDLADRLYVRVFRSYFLEATPARTDLPVDATGSGLRSVTLDTSTWCDTGDVGREFVFEVLVADKPFLDLATPPKFRALPDDAGRSSAFWVMTCEQ